MAGAVRYRNGFNTQSGERLHGAAHLAQSLGKIWSTRMNERVMLLAFGSDLRSLLSEDLTPSIALLIYNELVVSAAKWEPEYVLTQLQLVSMTEGGALGLRHAGLYFPEGRFGNFDIAAALTLPAIPLAWKGAAA